MKGGDDGSGLRERSNGRACGSEGRWSCCSISRVEDGRRYPAVVKRGPRVLAKPSRIKLWAPILLIRRHWNICSPNGLLCWPHGQKGLSVSLNRGRQSLRGADRLAKESEAGGEFDWEGWGGFVSGMWAGGEFGDCCRD